MAKKKKSAKGTKKAKKDIVQVGPLQGAIDTFHGGDYVAARQAFEKKIAEGDLSDENQHVARRMLGSMGLDKGTLQVGLACIALYVLVILVGWLKQP